MGIPIYNLYLYECNYLNIVKKHTLNWAWWTTPVIPTTLEVEAGGGSQI
jgi:hypothetical protein